MRTVYVNTERKSYPVHIGCGISEKQSLFISAAAGSRNAAVITDDIVDVLCCGQIAATLKRAGFNVVKYVLGNGERAKTTENYLKLLSFLAENKFSRNDTVFALGGGVVGDLAGFAAATYMRGMRLVHIPTTLLAAVDSSIGGKTAVNLDEGKNLAGVFYQPECVICDPDLLSSLPEGIFSDGCAEIIKYGAICSPELFEMLKSPIKPHIEEIIELCVKIKSGLVAEDEFDTGKRQLLNFGHTFGHAIEKCSNYSISHGSAVSVGMVMAASAAADMKICKTECADEIKLILKAYNLPCRTGYSEQSLYSAILSDKKRCWDTIAFVLPEEIGRCTIKNFSLRDARDVLHSSMKGSEIQWM